MTRSHATFCATVFAATLSAPAFADDAPGYAGKGALVIQTSLAGANVTIGGNIAFEERDPDIRIDVLSLGIPGADPTLSTLMSTQLFPPGGFTVIYDRRASTYVVWSSAKRLYYSPPAKAASATPQPAVTASPAASTTNGLFAVFTFLRTLKDDKTFSVLLALTGHGKTNGHPSTGLHFEYKKTTVSGESADFHGELKLADDLGEIPVEIAASVKTKDIPQSSLRLDATSIAQNVLPESDFDVPPGYARAAGIGDVIGKVLPQ